MHATIRFPFPSYPEGWYCPAFSSEVTQGRWAQVPYMGQMVLLKRLPNGGVEARGLPGAHSELEERHGSILHFFGNNEKWPIHPAQAFSFCNAICQSWTVNTHPQEVIENTVDTAHFGKVHGYSSLHVVEPISMQGPYLQAAFRVQRGLGFAEKIIPKKLEMLLSIRASGLGYSRVDIHLKALGLRLCQVVMPTPISTESVRFFATTQVGIGEQLHAKTKVAQLLPLPTMARGLAHLAAKGMAKDVKQDFPIWENKAYMHPPSLVKNDGPIGAYRKWAGQFYPNTQTATINTISISGATQ